MERTIEGNILATYNYNGARVHIIDNHLTLTHEEGQKVMDEITEMFQHALYKQEQEKKQG